MPGCTLFLLAPGEVGEDREAGGAFCSDAGGSSYIRGEVPKWSGECLEKVCNHEKESKTRRAERRRKERGGKKMKTSFFSDRASHLSSLPSACQGGMERERLHKG